MIPTDMTIVAKIQAHPVLSTVTGGAGALLAQVGQAAYEKTPAFSMFAVWLGLLVPLLIALGHLPKAFFGLVKFYKAVKYWLTHDFELPPKE